MKTHVSSILCSLLLAAVSIAQGASIPSVDVTVATASGKMAYKGKTTANGTFATGKLEPGNYIVQFNSSNAALKSGQYMLVVSAGKKKVSADDIAGDKFGKGGVAMKVDVGPGMSITGQVAPAGQQMAAAANPLKFKMMNGKRYVWVKEVGSNLGKWVEEGTPEAGNVIRSNQEGLRHMQDNGQSGTPH
ncbi:MAG: carboxypeptidase-like regulatory domain-containing protein [Verrucomicrobiota bacterium]|nr:carboxypeptidase-like regulatory domain-containing protein [Verrucomicrobiota bacterium]